MQVSGISGGVTTAPTSGLGAAGPAGSSAGIGNTAASGLSQNGSTAMQTLVDTLQGFSSAEILLALFLMAATQEKGRDDHDSTAMAFLAGLALAGQLGQGGNLSFQLTGDLSSIGSATGSGVGMTLNVMV